MLFRSNGVLNANDWRENEGMNPIPEEQGGEIYWQEGPSGQNGGSSRQADPAPNPQGSPRSGKA